jgi:hypothetical protein
MLCYLIPQPTIEEKKERTQYLPPYLKRSIMSQKFYVGDLIADSSLLAAIKLFGGDTLMRITAANPCTDMISIARNGDTLKCEDYLWMTLSLNNNSSVIVASIFLTAYFQNSIVIAQPNFLYESCSTPNDTLFTKQRSLQYDYIGAETAWDFTTGKHCIKIGIVDDGLDYRHPDLGGGKRLGKKVTGVVGLLRSYAVEQEWNDFLEPENYEGMIKASAQDVDKPEPIYKVGYGSLSGWGHLQADTVFLMLNKGYRVSHFTSNQPLDSGEWSNMMDDFTFYKDGRPGKLLDSSDYNVKIRKRYGTITLPDKWFINESNKLYVWGRSGQGSIGGYSGEHPNSQTRWTLVTSGTGGNGFVEGIIHNHSLDMEAYTFQYAVWDTGGNYLGIYPPNDQILLNISVFGRESALDVKEHNSLNSEFNFYLYPNPASEVLNIEFELKNTKKVNINIFDLYGRKISGGITRIYGNGDNELKFDISGINTGYYLCRIKINGNVYSKSFVVL